MSKQTANRIAFICIIGIIAGFTATGCAIGFYFFKYNDAAIAACGVGMALVGGKICWHIANNWAAVPYPPDYEDKARRTIIERLEAAQAYENGSAEDRRKAKRDKLDRARQEVHNALRGRK